MSTETHVRTVHLPAPTAWPIVLAFGITLLFAGLVTKRGRLRCWGWSWPCRRPWAGSEASCRSRRTCSCRSTPPRGRRP